MNRSGPAHGKTYVLLVTTRVIAKSDQEYLVVQLVLEIIYDPIEIAQSEVIEL